MVDYSVLKELTELEDDEENDFVLEYAQEARDFLLRMSWCKSIARLLYGAGCEGIYAIFLADVEPDRPEVDKLLWVVVGDMPPAYLVTDEIENPLDALRIYIEEMRSWVSAANSGESVENIIPVNVPPTKENAKMLEVRLSFLERHFVKGEPLGPATEENT